eukprot:TRINITY_DN2627_c0_g1_i2.p1 TRINITY_DN2627_c0_g1~~TRINITY_DN2627_c0_g1_i2.p1  ORF type:complete len:622 (+),score=101.43 TRINITY_DN2627_c0_g1_i2:168-2033(+)
MIQRDATNDLFCAMDEMNSSGSMMSPGSDIVLLDSEFEEDVFNRLQWYNMKLRFTDERKFPLFSGMKVYFDSDIYYYDSRKKSVDDQPENLDDGIMLNIDCICFTDRTIIDKCDKCIEKDKRLILKKRKADNPTWDERDEMNNTKVIQVSPSGNETVASDGSVTFKLRIGCCVGLHKQHHKNHVGKDGTKGIHSKCFGASLHFKAYSNSFNRKIEHISTSIRIIGKVVSNNRKKRKLTSMTKEIDFHDNNKSLFGILQEGYNVDPASLLHKLVRTYDQFIGFLFSHKLGDIFTVDFFKTNNINSIKEDSPLMMEVFTTIGCGACVYDFELTSHYLSKAMEIVPSVNMDNLTFEDGLSVVRSFNKITMYQSVFGNTERALEFNNMAIQILINLSRRSYVDAFNNSTYENTIWCKCGLSFDPVVIKQAIEWGVDLDKPRTVSFSLMLMILCVLFPELSDVPNRSNGSMNYILIDSIQQETALSLLGELKTSLNRFILEDNHMNSLKVEAFLAFENWLLGKREEAGTHTTKGCIMCALSKELNLSSYISVLLSAVVSFQLSSEDPSKNEECQIFLQALLDNVYLKWLNFLPRWISAGIPNSKITETFTPLPLQYSPQVEEVLPF